MTHKTKREKEITQEEMQKQIEETKEEAHETVKSKKSKYKQEQNFVNRVGESVIKGYKILGEKARKSIDDFKEKISRKNKATKAGNNEINEDNEKSSNDKREEKNKVVNENKTK
jgi:hypothetical protein